MNRGSNNHGCLLSVKPVHLQIFFCRTSPPSCSDRVPAEQQIDTNSKTQQCNRVRIQSTSAPKRGHNMAQPSPMGSTQKATNHGITSTFLAMCRTGSFQGVCDLFRCVSLLALEFRQLEVYVDYTGTSTGIAWTTLEINIICPLDFWIERLSERCHVLPTRRTERLTLHRAESHGPQTRPPSSEAAPGHLRHCAPAAQRANYTPAFANHGSTYRT